MTVTFLLFVCFTPLWLFILHAILSHCFLKLKVSNQRLAIIVCFLGVIFINIGVSFFKPFCFCSLLAAFSISTLLAHIYFHLFNMSETSRRLHIMTALKYGKRPLSQYTPEEMVSLRLDRLHSTNHITFEHEKYYWRKTLFSYVCVCMAAYEKLLFPRRFNN